MGNGDDAFLRSESSEALMKRFQTGDNRAFDVLYNRFHPYVFGLHRRHLRSQYRFVDVNAEAEELTQETFLKFFRLRYTWNPDKGSVWAFLLTITNTNSLSLLRSAQLRARQLIAAPAQLGLVGTDAKGTLFGTAGYTVGAHSELDIERALSQLPSQMREIIIDSYYLGLTAEEIADITGLKANTVRGIIHRAKKRLAHLLDDSDT
jgi:RNA polymerase sigma-70 factor, ECF subfamily